MDQGVAVAGWLILVAGAVVSMTVLGLVALAWVLIRRGNRRRDESED